MKVNHRWRSKRLKYVADRATEKASVEPGSHYVGLENVEPWTGRYLPTEAQIETESVRFRCGDVLFGKLRPYLAKVHVARTDGTCTSELLVLHPGPEVSAEFLFYRLVSGDFIDSVNSTTFGSKMPRADWEQIGSLRVAIPSLGEQAKIVSYLDAKTVEIDRLVEKKQRLIELLDEKRAALISRAVTQGLDLGVTMKDSGVEWLGSVPTHWDVAPLNSRFDVKLGKMLDARQITGQQLVPYLRNVDVQWDEIAVSDLPSMDFDTDDRERFRLRPGDLIVCEGGEVGRAAVWQG
ncbi:MAG: restriction endonuclease subunit S, partial [Bryobacteraceae bacterium]